MQISLKKYVLPLRHTFSISRESHDFQNTLIVSLSLNGKMGYGEATSNPYYKITVESMMLEIEVIQTEIENFDFTTPDIFHDFLVAKGLTNFAICALDLAAHDLYGKLLDKPLYQIWNTAITAYPTTNYTIGIASVSEMVAKMIAFPWPIYKIKLGTADDVAIIRELRKHTDAIFRIDANCAWTATETIHNAPLLKDLGVEFLEQPLKANDWEGMELVMHNSVLPVIADESCIVETDVEKCALHFNGINIKLTKCGGLTPALRMILKGKELGLKVMVGCMTESTVGISAIAQLLPQLDYVDMDGALLLKEDIAKGVQITSGGNVLFSKTAREWRYPKLMLHYTDSFPGKEIYINGIPHLYFGGTSYLGLQTDVDFQNTFIKNIRIYGTNYGASRKSNIQLSIFEETEAYLSQTVGSEACLTISSGYLAGQLVVQFLNDKAHKFFYTPNTHTALFEGKRKVYYQNYGKLKKALDIHLKSNEKSVPVILLDSIDFTANNYPSFTGLKTLPLEKVILVVDDSHGIGIVGENGGGIYKEIKALGAKELIVCCSLGKGFGVQGGAIFGNKKRIDEFSATQFFGGASPASPAGLATLLNSETIYQKKRGVLKENIYDLTTNLENFERFVHMAEHPTFSFSDAPLVQKLEKNHILVTNFNYPDENSALMSRIVLSASHKKEDIQKLCSHLNAP